MERILLFGSTGFIGGYIVKEFQHVTAATRGEISDRTFIVSELDRVKPTIVINAAGKTGRPNVDWCEDHKEETMRANVMGPLVLAEECMKRGIYFVHLGSGCIYQSPSPEGGYIETDPPNFYGSYYSLTKFTSDLLLQHFPCLNLRLRMPFDGTRNDRNLIMKISKYRKVLDEPNSATYIPDFIEALRILMEKKATGTYNVVNPGPITAYQIMQRYKEYFPDAPPFERLLARDLGTVAKAARSNCIVSSEKLAREGITMKPAAEAVEEALKKLAEESAA